MISGGASIADGARRGSGLKYTNYMDKQDSTAAPENASGPIEEGGHPLPHDLTEGPLLRAVLRGAWVDAGSGRPLVSPIRSVRISPSLDGAEGDCLAPLGLGTRLAVVADGATWSALGRRVARALRVGAAVDAIVLKEPHPDAATVSEILERSRAMRPASSRSAPAWSTISARRPRRRAADPTPCSARPRR